MKPLVIYHASCADGFAAAFAAWLKFGDEAEYVPSQYGTKEDLLNLNIKDREIYILDFSFPRIAMDYVFTTAKRVVWLDHHKTAFEMWCGKYKKGMIHQSGEFDKQLILLNDNKSGAYLAWEYFHPDTEVPMFIRHIDDYDRWIFALKGTKAFNKALWSYAPWSFTQWRDWFCNEFEEDMVPYARRFMVRIYTEGEAILRAHDQNVAAVLKNAARGCTIQIPSFKGQNCADTNYPGHEVTGLAADCPPHLASDVGHELANRCGTFGLLWAIDKDLRCKCSLRSNGDYDVSAIAKAFGGGGHRNAAGFEVPMGILLGWLK